MFLSAIIIKNSPNRICTIKEVLYRTLNSDMKVSLVLSSRVGDHAGVLPLVGHHGVLYVEGVTAFLNAGMEVSCQQLEET